LCPIEDHKRRDICFPPSIATFTNWESSLLSLTAPRPPQRRYERWKQNEYSELTQRYGEVEKCNSETRGDPCALNKFTERSYMPILSKYSSDFNKRFEIADSNNSHGLHNNAQSSYYDSDSDFDSDSDSMSPKAKRSAGNIFILVFTVLLLTA
jgi:hypothetical protein